MTSHKGTLTRLQGDPPAKRMMQVISRFLRDQRKHGGLETLSDHMLRDIGLTRDNVSRAKRTNLLF